MRRGDFIVFLVAVIFLGGGSFSVAEAVNAPTAFTATATSSCAILLEWEDENPVDTTYDIKRGVAISSDQVTKGAGDLYFTDEHNSSPWGVPIDPGDTYAYSIRAKNPNTPAPAQSGWVGPENTTTFLLPSKPGQPINVTSTVDGTGNIEISWATSTVGSEYFDEYGGSEIWLATGDGSTYDPFSNIIRVPGDPNTVVSGKFVYPSSSNDKDLSYQYKLRIQEVGGLGCDNTRSQHVIFSDDSDVLTIPRRPNIDNINTQFVSEQSKITFAWNNNQSSPNETRFEIHRSTFSDFNPHVTIPADPDDTSHDDIAGIDIIQNPPTIYHYRIRSCINDTCSFWSDTATVTTGLPVTSNLGLRISYATAVYATTMLTWTPEGDIIIGSELRIERATSNTAFQEIAQLGHNDSRRGTGVYLDEQLPLGETYIYRIRVCDGAGGGADCSGYSSDPPSANLDLLFILKGVAWAAQTGPEGMGWIKFNSAAEDVGSGSSIPYSVQIDKTGLITGAAWAGEYGWLSFNSDDLTECHSGTCEAWFDSGTKQFSGWARFMAPENFVAGESNWDGWISLSGTTQTASLYSPFTTLASLFNAPAFIKKPFSVLTSLFDFATAYAQGAPYGVQLGTCVDKVCPLSGVAWGSELVGWIGFGLDCGTDGGGNPKCTARAELINEPPAVSNVQIVAGGDWCVETPFYSVQWDFSDPDDDLHEGAEVALVRANVTDFDGTGATMLSVVNTPDSTYTLFTERFSDPLGYIVTGNYNQTGYLATGTSYKPWVRVFDGFGWSDWVDSINTTTTPSHYGPYIQDPAIVWNPDAPPRFSKATSTAMVDDRSGQGIQDYVWTFEGAFPTPQTTYTSSTEVTLTSGTVTTTIAITDNIGDEFSICRVGESYIFSEEGNIPIKRRIFRER